LKIKSPILGGELEKMTEYLMLFLIGYYTTSIGLSVLEYFMNRKRKNRRRMDGIY
jgi:hypothetical protein